MKTLGTQKRYLIYLIVGLSLASIFLAVIGLQNRSNAMNAPSDRIVNSNEFYVLRGRPTNFQQDLFKELTQALNADPRSDLVLVELVVKNFIADYFTWTNKNGPYDVGGGNFLFSLEGTNFYRSSRRYFYASMTPYLNAGLRFSDLIEVVDIQTNGADYAAAFDYYGDLYEAFYIEIDWVYRENAALDLTLFPTSASFTVIKHNGRFEIVRFY
jgi:hypothetical protein